MQASPTFKMTERNFLTIRIIALAFICLLAGACYSPPFKEPELRPVEDSDPYDAVESFKRRLPESFETENTIQLRFFRHSIAALGYASVNRSEGTFEFACVNHMGMQLFHITGERDGSKLTYAIPEFKERPEFAEALGEDIRRIYFDLLPEEGAKAKLHRRHFTFKRSKDDKETVEYKFGGKQNALLRKRAKAGWRTNWEASFYEYFEVTDGEDVYLFPRGIVLHNRRHRYRLIVRTRSVEL